MTLAMAGGHSRPLVATPTVIGRTPQYIPPPPNVTDGYEKWYAEPGCNNRMLMALRSTIDKEIAWALDRLCRLSQNEQFSLQDMPGLTEALFEWPYWYLREVHELNRRASLFSLDPLLERRQRHALESIFVLRNAAMNEKNTEMLATNGKTQGVILSALHRVPQDTDAAVEFVQYCIEMFLPIVPSVTLPHPEHLPFQANPIFPLQYFAKTSQNRNMIIASLATLAVLFSHPINVAHLTSDNNGLEAAIQYLPLLTDKPLVEASLNYLYAHLSHPPMTKAFLLHPRMPATLKLLVSILRSEQVEENVTIEVGGPVYTAPALIVPTKDHELTQDELSSLLVMPEPQRCYQWMQLVFQPNPAGEVTQVDLWTMYKTLFTPQPDHAPPLVASDVIKNVSTVFTQAQAMVLPGPPQRFVVMGIERRQDEAIGEKYKCHWDQSQCTAIPFGSTEELYDHVLADHIDPAANSQSCSWATCNRVSVAKSAIRGHVLTHLPSVQPEPRHPSQPDTITLPSFGYPHPIPDPTQRPPPPARSTLSYPRPVVDPPSNALTALLCIRILFRAAFASSDAAPRADEDHFGFPGVIEDTGEQDDLDRSGWTAAEKDGERRGRRAFVGIRHLLEDVRIQDETLMDWVNEMIDAGITGTT